MSHNHMYRLCHLCSGWLSPGHYNGSLLMVEEERDQFMALIFSVCTCSNVHTHTTSNDTQHIIYTVCAACVVAGCPRGTATGACDNRGSEREVQVIWPCLSVHVEYSTGRCGKEGNEQHFLPRLRPLIVAA